MREHGNALAQAGPVRTVSCSPLRHALACVHAGVIQLVECQLPKLDVAGSSPVARSEMQSPYSEKSETRRAHVRPAGSFVRHPVSSSVECLGPQPLEDVEVLEGDPAGLVGS